jgi:hypothetical protein
MGVGAAVLVAEQAAAGRPAERIVPGEVIPDLEARRIPGFRCIDWPGASEPTTSSS